MKGEMKSEKGEVTPKVGPTIEGWLNKYKRALSGWKPRKFILDGGILSYYKQKKGSGPFIHLGSASVQGAVVSCSSSDERRFQVKTATLNFYLKARTNDERATWVESLLAEGATSKKSLPDHTPASPAKDMHSVDDFDDVEDKIKIVENLRSELISQLHVLQEKCKKDGTKELCMNFGVTSQAFLAAVTQTVACLHQSDAEGREYLLEEREKRHQLENTIRSLASDHARLERVVSLTSLDVEVTDEQFEDAEDDATWMSSCSDNDSVLARLQQEHLILPISPMAMQSRPKSLTLLSPNPKPVAVSAVSPKPKHDEGVVVVSSRRTCLPANQALRTMSLWGVLKSNVGKDLSKIALPVVFNEPLSFLQRLCEDLEYSTILDAAAASDDAGLRCAYVAAFAVSNYSSTPGRLYKPFNPLLGETFQFEREDGGFRYFGEQVSHHPPVTAGHAEGKGWVFWEDALVKNKFCGKYLEVYQRGTCRLRLTKTNEEFSWNKPTTCIHNIIIGKLWIDHYGTMEVVNHTNNYACTLKVHERGWFSSGPPRLVTGTVEDDNKTALYNVIGNWAEGMTATAVAEDGSAVGDEITLWTVAPRPELSREQYQFTTFSMQLNDMQGVDQDKLCPTDSRLRPDQRLLENGDVDGAEKEKFRLENKQRKGRKGRDSSNQEWQPLWFTQDTDEFTGRSLWVSNGKFFSAMDAGNFGDTPDIF